MHDILRNLVDMKKNHGGEKLYIKTRISTQYGPILKAQVSESVSGMNKSVLEHMYCTVGQMT